jgi:hypothetical protein
VLRRVEVPDDPHLLDLVDSLRASDVEAVILY